MTWHMRDEAQRGMARADAAVAADEKQPRLLAYFAAVLAAAERACAAHGTVECRFRVRGSDVRVGFAGTALVPALTPALAHLAAGETSPGEVAAPPLTITVWDSASTGVPLPPYTGEDEAEVTRREAPESIYSVFQHGQDTLSMFDPVTHRAVLWLPDAASITYHDRGAPFRTILHWALALGGWQLLHAAAVGTDTGGVLLVGKGGSGKSTTALACLAAGMVYVSDDYVLARPTPPYAAALYSSAKLHADSLRRFPRLARRVSNPDRPADEKALLYLGTASDFAKQLRPGFPIRAILAPRVTGRTETALWPMAAAESLARLAPSTIFQLPYAGHGAFRTMAALVRQVPSYWLEAGTDLPRIPAAITALLTHLEQSRSSQEMEAERG